MRRQTTGLLTLVLIAALAALAHGAAAAPPEVVAGVAQLEHAYADFNDAYGAVSLIDSDPDR